jgi:MFS family permease
MIALVNFFNVTPGAQLVLLAKRQLAATDSQVSFLYAAGSVGVVGLSLLAGPLCRRLSFPVVTLGALILNGLATAILGLTRWYVPAAVCWAVATGFGVLFNINTLSLRQQIVPDQLLGRILSIAGVIGWSAVPLGALVGSAVIAVTGNVGLVYTAIGLITATIAIGFSRSPLGRAEQYLRQAESGDLVRR